MGYAMQHHCVFLAMQVVDYRYAQMEAIILNTWRNNEFNNRSIFILSRPEVILSSHVTSTHVRMEDA